MGGGGGSVDVSGIGGRGGFGGGGGRGSLTGGAGGFGGGGGGADEFGGGGGAGGFGGGGGGGNNGGDGGLGGFGSGGGGGDQPGLPGFGGGPSTDCGAGTGCAGVGAGFGGSLFGLGPSSIRIQDSLSMAGGLAQGGGADPSANAGGEGIFLAGSGVIEFEPGIGINQVLDDPIADQRGLWAQLGITTDQSYPSGGIFSAMNFPNAWQYTADARWSLRKLGAGQLSLSTDNDYSGGSTLESGNVLLGAARALGIGPVSNAATLQLATPLNLQVGAAGAVEANYSQAASGRLRLGFGGPGCELDQIQVRDLADLNGELSIDSSLCDPALSSTHLLIRAAQRRGQFSNAPGPEFVSNGMRYAISYLASEVQITVLGPDSEIFSNSFE